jgi:aspartyl-tRNA(Asn)/glutamyl-tRNA(Gln) amidotransferase subunit A
LKAFAGGVRVGVPENFFFEAVNPEVNDCVRRAADLLKQSGAHLVPIRVPDPHALNTTARVILLAEATAQYGPYLDRPELFGPDVFAVLVQGVAIPATAYVNAQRLRYELRELWRRVFDDIDILLTPTAPITAPKIGQTVVSINGIEEDVRLATTRFVRGFNLLGLPAISIPVGFDTQHLPVGAQLIGRAFEDQLVLNVAAELENQLSNRA